MSILSLRIFIAGTSVEVDGASLVPRSASFRSMFRVRSCPLRQVDMRLYLPFPDFDLVFVISDGLIVLIDDGSNGGDYIPIRRVMYLLSPGVISSQRAPHYQHYNFDLEKLY